MTLLDEGVGHGDIRETERELKGQEWAAGILKLDDVRELVPEAADFATRAIQAYGDRVLVRDMPFQRKVGSIWLVGGKQLDIQVSRVVSIGPRCKSRPWDFVVGDYVLHVRVAGVRYDETLGALGRQALSASHNGSGSLVFLKEEECLAIVSPELAATITGGGEVDGGKFGIRKLSDY